MMKGCFVEKPVILCAPKPRSLALIFTPANLTLLRVTYHLIEVEQGDIAGLSADVLAQVSYIIGQPALSRVTLAALINLRCIFNVESNLLNNMPYDVLFERGIHVVTTGAVFAKPVAELGLGLALCLALCLCRAKAEHSRQGGRGYDGYKFRCYFVPNRRNIRPNLGHSRNLGARLSHIGPTSLP